MLSNKGNVYQLLITLSSFCAIFFDFWMNDVSGMIANYRYKYVASPKQNYCSNISNILSRSDNAKSRAKSPGCNSSSICVTPFEGEVAIKI